MQAALIFTPYDNGTFLVDSRESPDEVHILDAIERTCSCPGFSFNKSCQHLTALMSQLDTETGELQLAPEEPGEPPMKQLAPYDEFKTKIENIRKTAESITVTDISQTSEMKIARTTRLALKDIRIAITHRHKELKEGILVEGRKIDAGKNELLAVLEPLELRLKDQEEFIERETARIQAEKRIARIAEITPYLSAPLAIDLGVILDDRYHAMLSDAKAAHAAKLEREQREKEEAIERERVEKLSRARAIELAPMVRFITVKLENLGAMNEGEYAAILSNSQTAQKAEADAIEAQRVENERLKKEAQEREAKAKSEREAAAKQLAEERRLAAEREKAERLAYEKQVREAQEKARKEREELQAKADAEAKAARNAARIERETAELKARQEHEEAAEENARLAKIAEEQRQKAAESARLAREAKEKAEREEAQRQAEAEAEKKRIADEAEAKAKAPQKEKLKDFAMSVRRESLGLLASSNIAHVKEISEGVERFAKWIEKKAAEL